jgi:hypothetical protein
VDTSTAIFAIQSTAALLAYGFIARAYLWPRLVRWPIAAALSALLWIHTFRTLGLTTLVPGVVDLSVPRGFVTPLAVGDLAAAVLAALALVALAARWPAAIPLVWLANVEGILDLAFVTYQGIVIRAASYPLGAAWYIPTYFVPALWVSHAMMLILLLRRSVRSRVDMGGNRVG